VHGNLCVASCPIIRIQYRITTQKVANIIIFDEEGEIRSNFGYVCKHPVQNLLSSTVKKSGKKCNVCIM